MKLRGEFVIRQVMDSIVAIPVGSTALQLNGMILLNDVSNVIWQCLEKQTDVAAIVAAVTGEFNVTAAVAEADILEFLDSLRNAQLLEE